MMQMNIERVINATGSLLIWLVMILAAVILVGLIVIAVNAIGQGIKVIAEDIEFAESKATAEGSGGAGGHQKPDQTENDGFMNIPEGIDEELPFN